jgi:peptide/nickel transport system ATP-binding protein
VPLLEVHDLSVSFLQYRNGLRHNELNVIRNLNVTVDNGEILAVLGSSGSGKSLLAHAILGILPNNAKMSGTIKFEGVHLNSEKQKRIRGKEIALIPQSVNYLDPLMKIATQIRTAVNSNDPIRAQRSVFERYHLGKEVEKKYPFQLSGGMARRVLVSTAMVSGAKLVVADEPTPGLDPIVIKEALQYFRELADSGCGVLMITHDIEAALSIADKVAVFYAGTTVEIASVTDFKNGGELLRHPYSKALWNALPQNGFQPIPGSQPLANSLLPGCLFAPRCAFATTECSKSQPEARELRQGIVRCIHAS